MEAYFAISAGILRLLTLHLPLVFAAWIISRVLYRQGGTIVRATTGLTLYFLAVTVSPWLLPRLNFFQLQICSVVIFAAAFIVARVFFPNALARRPGNAGPLRLAPLFFLFGFMFLNNIWFTGLNHDPLTYQLHFAASWLQEGRLFIVPTPFGDPSQAYGAALASTFYVWLMAPMRSDLLAAGGGLGFFALTCFGALGMARECGAEPRRLALPAALLTLAPLTFFEGTRALSDITVAAFFTGSIYFFLRATRTAAGPDAALGLIAAGLTAGSKYTGLWLLPALVPMALAGLWAARRPAAIAAGLTLGFAGGGLWYARNWALTGNPIYPIEVSVAGLDLPGLYDRDVMMGWVFHLETWHERLGMMRTNLSPTFIALGLVAIGWLLVTGIRLAQGRDLPAGFKPTDPGPSLGRGLALIFTALAPIWVDIVNWKIYPFQIDRFWIPGVAVLAAVSGAFVSRSRWLSLAALPVVVVGFILLPPPTYLGQLTRYWPWAGVWVLVLVWWGWQWLLDRPRSHPWLRLAPVGLALLMLAGMLPAVKSWPNHRRRALSTLEYIHGWNALPKGSSTVAYTGANLPHALRGPALERRVIYVSTAGAVMPADHEVMAGRKLPFNTPEPVVSRLENCPSRWAAALVDERVDYLVVMRVIRNSLVNTAHDVQGWVLEDGWARKNPKMFELIFADHATRVYRLHPSAEAPPAMPGECFSVPADALAACGGGQVVACRTWFPLATGAMLEMGWPR